MFSSALDDGAEIEGVFDSLGAARRMAGRLIAAAEEERPEGGRFAPESYDNLWKREYAHQYVGIVVRVLNEGLPVAPLAADLTIAPR